MYGGRDGVRRWAARGEDCFEVPGSVLVLGGSLCGPASPSRHDRSRHHHGVRITEGCDEPIELDACEQPCRDVRLREIAVGKFVERRARRSAHDEATVRFRVDINETCSSKVAR